jgi:DNA mismatch repair protein MutL
VRFRDQSLIHEVVRRALMDTLGRGGVPELQLQPEFQSRTEVAMSIPGVLAGGVYPSRWAPGATGLGRPSTSGVGVNPGGSPSTVGAAGELREPGAPRASGVPDIRPMIPLGQFRDTFIIAVDDEGLAIIDQHVAHERVLFERVMERLGAGRLESQRLLEPLLVELSTEGRQALLSHAADLDRLGFGVDDFGGDTLRITAVPALLGREQSAVAVRALAEDLEGVDRGNTVADALRRIAATVACHAAVKANYPLTHEKMLHILDELRRTAYSTVCPHGRPVMLRLTRREIEKNFQRI